MKFVLFCQNPYAFGILAPIKDVLIEREHLYIWFLTENIVGKLPFNNDPSTNDIKKLKEYEADAILCPGNEVPHYLRGLKVQIFHGLAGEKKGHFRIRHYFDLYLTQGPYFTSRFKELQKKYTDFDVIETGWSKLDTYGQNLRKYAGDKKAFLQKYQTNKLILYAPTFSPSLTSAPYLAEEITKLAENEHFLVVIKFHDLMAQEVIDIYKALAAKRKNIIIEKAPNILRLLLMADLMISDTSSVVYEFLLLNKPVITFRSNSENILWENSEAYSHLTEKVVKNLAEDPFRQKREKIIENYHPYSDGKSSLRMVNAIEEYIKENGVPEKRKLSFLRRLKINRMFGK
ncbi:CDP-glycerol glycerophosphotransferase family protein [Autumnicola edwardsiae]|uniref:CDP-glycerol glycerophosphotransferase family protein n=1 Tax=Autumnicola edwardsiae TaxID=3075594 RepID=A0ABU3CV46_9FLAO|nr:CDP-glycerol glycerophosphotransferase family protein [Zunongwangia sp. F297]MDT0650156.1 CDP-glycerol glycerophosphotransferase family protein [Zunongwangia sp. F297]